MKKETKPNTVIPKGVFFEETIETVNEEEMLYPVFVKSDNLATHNKKVDQNTVSFTYGKLTGFPVTPTGETRQFLDGSINGEKFELICDENIEVPFPVYSAIQKLISKGKK